MTDLEIIEKKANIKLLSFLLDYLCNSELPETGRLAIKRLQTKYIQDVTTSVENKTPNCNGD